MLKNLLSVVVLGLSVAACATQDPSLPHQQQAFATQRPVLNTVNIIDDRLQTTTVRPGGGALVSTKLAVEGAGQSTTATGGREVWVSLRNLTDYQQNIEARVTWYDSSERPVDGPSAWGRVFLTANGGQTWTSQSVHPAASQFYIEIRELR